MGNFNVRLADNQTLNQRFIYHLLEDVKALTYMIEHNLLEDNVVRIGAEQEMCLVDSDLKPSPRNLELLKAINHSDIVSELANFNIEINLNPRNLEGNCFQKLEQELLHKIDLVNAQANKLDIQTIITGILPTIRKSDVSHKNVTPIDRYLFLLNLLNELRGSHLELNIRGTDELNVQHDSSLMEACNTSFQMHLQICPKYFVHQYNFAQLIAAPVMAIAVNSPLLLGKRLWHETRIALFQQSLETRRKHEHIRDESPRVIFGNGWLKNSITELYKEDITRFQVLLNSDIEKGSMQVLKEGGIPELKALTTHNGTVYRWNRPCYGIGENGKPHLRIENRIFSAGPTVVDQIANSAFWVGLMNGYECDMSEVIKSMSFDDARNNFFAACRYGINSYFHWLDGKRIDATELILDQLIPMAKHGLQKANIAEDDIQRYLGIIQKRAEKSVTGASWALASYNQLSKSVGREESIIAITAKMIEKQKINEPVHNWELASIQDIKNWSPHNLKVEEFMTTDLFTAKPSDLIALAADIVDWQTIRYLPIENDNGELVGLLSSRMLLNHFKATSSYFEEEQRPQLIHEIMHKNPITISPYQTIIEAINLMEKNKIGCLPVVKKNRLVGIVTEMDFLRLSGRLIKRIGEIKKSSI